MNLRILLDLLLSLSPDDRYTELSSTAAIRDLRCSGVLHPKALCPPWAVHANAYLCFPFPGAVHRAATHEFRFGIPRTDMYYVSFLPRTYTFVVARSEEQVLLATHRLTQFTSLDHLRLTVGTQTSQLLLGTSAPRLDPPPPRLTIDAPPDRLLLDAPPARFMPDGPPTTAASDRLSSTASCFTGVEKVSEFLFPFIDAPHPQTFGIPTPFLVALSFILFACLYPTLDTILSYALLSNAMFCQTCDLTNANMRLLALLDMLKPVAEFNRKVKNASNDLLSIVALDRNMVVHTLASVVRPLILIRFIDCADDKQFVNETWFFATAISRQILAMLFMSSVIGSVIYIPSSRGLTLVCIATALLLSLLPRENVTRTTVRRCKCSAAPYQAVQSQVLKAPVVTAYKNEDRPIKLVSPAARGRIRRAAMNYRKELRRQNHLVLLHETQMRSYAALV